MSADAGIEPRTVASTVRDAKHYRLHPIHTRLHLIHTGLYLIHIWLHPIQTRLHPIHTRLLPTTILDYISSTLGYIPPHTLGYIPSTLGYIPSTQVTSHPHYCRLHLWKKELIVRFLRSRMQTGTNFWKESFLLDKYLVRATKIFWSPEVLTIKDHILLVVLN